MRIVTPFAIEQNEPIWQGAVSQAMINVAPFSIDDLPIDTDPFIKTGPILQCRPIETSVEMFANEDTSVLVQRELERSVSFVIPKTRIEI